MPPPNGTAADAAKYSGIPLKGKKGAKSSKKKVKAKNTKASQEPLGAVWGGSPHERNRDATQTTATGANYPTGKAKSLSLPTTKLGMLGAAVNPMGAIAKGAGKVFLNQVNYGMNDQAQKLYQELLSNPANAGMSTKDLVNAARAPQINNQLDHAFIDNPTTQNQRDAVAAGTVSSTGGLMSGGTLVASSNQGGSQASPAPAEAPAEAPATQLGQLPNSNFSSFTERPDWAPSLRQPQGPNERPAWAPQQLTPYGQQRQNQGNSQMVGNNSFETGGGYGGTNNASQDTVRNFLGYGSNAGQQQPWQPNPENLAAVNNSRLNGPSMFGRETPQYGMDNGAAFATTGAMPLQAAPVVSEQAQRSDGLPTGNVMMPSMPVPMQDSQVPQLPTPPTGPRVPEGNPDSGTFKPITFRSGAGTSTTTEDGMTTELAAPYSGLSGLVGDSTGLMGEAAGLAQQAPNQVDTSFDTKERSQDLFDQRSDLLQPAFAQQNTRAKESMFGSGRLGLRLSGEGAGVGAEGGFVQPDALGVSRAQAQALAGLASQSTTDAFNQGMQRSGLALNQFNTNQAQNQQQYNNLQGSAQGMLGAGMQGAGIEQNLAQQQLDQQRLAQDYGQNQQNFGLAQQGQGFNQGMANRNFGLAQQGQGFNQGLASQNLGLAAQGQGFNQGMAQNQQNMDYGFGQQKMDLATQQQLQDYEMGMLRGDQNYGLQRDALAQNYELDTERNRIGLITGQAQANRANYQPNPWITGAVGLGTAYAGSAGGAAQIGEWGEDLYDWGSGLFS